MEAKSRPRIPSLWENKISIGFFQFSFFSIEIFNQDIQKKTPVRAFLHRGLPWPPSQTGSAPCLAMPRKALLGLALLRFSAVFRQTIFGMRCESRF
jgi:hypothetical protein